jgi:3-mercaptopropionate dioxygenase
MADVLVGNVTLDRFVQRMDTLIAESNGDEARILDEGQHLLRELVASDDWLPDDYAQPDADRFKQYVLHNVPGKDFTILCVVWGPGQAATPHNHTVWGMVGQLRGAELNRSYETPVAGEPMRLRSETTLMPGQTIALSPRIGDIHDVTNVADGVSVSIHVYGGDLERVAHRRNRFDAQTGEALPFHAQYY